MSPLAKGSVVVGAALVALHAPAVIAPVWTRRVARALPRSTVAAWILTGLDLIWVAWIVLHASLGRFEGLKPWVYVATPLSFLALVFFLDELLAARALGGLLLLVADPLLDAARWHDSPWRLIVTVTCYAWAVLGMLLVMSPYYLRKMLTPCLATDCRCRAAGVAGMLFGALLVGLALTVY